MYKKFLAVALAALLLVSLGACAKNNDANEPDPTPPVTDGNDTDDTDTTEPERSPWQQHELFGLIPEYNLGGTVGDFRSGDNGWHVDIADVTQEDYDSYLGMLRERGYTQESSTGNETIYVDSTNGVRVVLSHNAGGDNALRITGSRVDDMANDADGSGNNNEG